MVAPKQRMRAVEAVEPAPSTISPSILAPTSVRAGPPSTTSVTIDPSNVIPAIIQAQKADPDMQRLVHWVENKVSKAPGKVSSWSFPQQAWWKRHHQRRIAYVDYQGKKALTMDGKLIVPTSALPGVISIVHNEIGHRGVANTLDELRKRFEGHALLNRTQEIVGSCTACWEKTREIPTNKAHKHIPVSSTAVNQTLWLDTMGPCLLYTSPSPRDYAASRMPSSA